MNTTLIQLISEQAMPNLLSALAMEPGTLIHLDTPKTHAVSERLAETCRRAGLTVNAESVGLSAMPSLAETGRAVERAVALARSAGSLPIINFTGGTKLMSIGAWEAAKHLGVPSLYVDTQEKRFWDGETGDFAPFAESLADFQSAARKLRVDLVAYSNGISRVTAGHDPTPWIPLADLLLRDRNLERSVWESVNGNNGFIAKALGKSTFSPRDANQVLHFYETTLDGLPESAADLAVACGLLEETREGLKLATEQSGLNVPDEAHALLSNRLDKNEYRERLIRLRNAAQFPISFLSGTWLEVATYEFMRRSGRFHDLRWSVNVGEKDGYDLEEDVIALDGVRLAYVSCKRSGRLHAHAEEIRARANRIGGTFSNCFYVIHEMPYGPPKDDLLTRCKQLGHIRVISSAELITNHPFT